MLKLIKQSNSRERWLFGGNVAAMLLNISLAFVLPDSYATLLNWFVGGFLAAMTANLLFAIRLRLLLDKQHAVITSQTEFINRLLAPDFYEAQMRQVMEQAKRDGVLPSDVELHRIEPPKLH